MFTYKKHPIIRWDFSNISDFLDTGFTNEQLEWLCDSENNTNQRDKIYGEKNSPWLFWTSELYSFGKCYRRWLKWPYWLPIPVYSDHGADPDGELRNHEINNKAKYHLCFWSIRYSSILAQQNKIPIRVQHPWVTYRRSIGIEQSARAAGCLVFVPHSVPGIRVLDFDNKFEKLILNLQKYFDKTEIKLCIHMHDVRNNLHAHLRKFNLPIFSLGNSSSSLFVDRFYKLIRHFRAGSSTNSASQLYHCVELGLNYYLVGEEVTIQNDSHSDMPKGKIVDPKERELALKMDNIFFRERVKTKEDAKKWINDVLGVDQPHTMKPKELRKIFILESIRLAPQITFAILIYILRGILPNIIIKLIKKSRKVFVSI
jgi:hypothetical protein